MKKMILCIDSKDDAIAVFNVNFVDYGEIGEDQSLSDNKKVSVPIRKKRNN